MTDTQSRAAFEAWAVTDGLTLHTIALLTDPPQFGGYFDPATAQAWKVWQAAGRSTTTLPIDLPEPDAEIEVLTRPDHREINVDGWRDALPDGVYKVHTEQSVRTLLKAATQRGRQPAVDPPQTRMDIGFNVVGGVLPGIIIRRIELTDEQRRSLQADCDGPIPSAAPARPKAWWMRRNSLAATAPASEETAMAKFNVRQMALDAGFREAFPEEGELPAVWHLCSTAEIERLIEMAVAAEREAIAEYVDRNLMDNKAYAQAIRAREDAA